MPVDIDRMTHDELVALNQRIVERLKFLNSMQAHKDMMAFNIGARVSFDSGQNGRLLGTLLKFNRKTVTVVTDNGQKWNISPHLLKTPSQHNRSSMQMKNNLSDYRKPSQRAQHTTE